MNMLICKHVQSKDFHCSFLLTAAPIIIIQFTKHEEDSSSLTEIKPKRGKGPKWPLMVYEQPMNTGERLEMADVRKEGFPRWRILVRAWND